VDLVTPHEAVLPQAVGLGLTRNFSPFFLPLFHQTAHGGETHAYQETSEARVGRFKLTTMARDMVFETLMQPVHQPRQQESDNRDSNRGGSDDEHTGDKGRLRIGDAHSGILQSPRKMSRVGTFGGRLNRF
jgi:hypothetical protein